LIGAATPTGSVTLSMECKGPRQARQHLLLGEELAWEYGLALEAEGSDSHLTVRFSRAGRTEEADPRTVAKR
jgi:hypothetical protein